ncbi:MAG: uracil-DNA glycosylase family protein [Anaerolineae bacterium]
MTVPPDFQQLLKEVRACTLCAAHLPLGPRPVVQLHPNAKILIVSQAPGRKVHETGIPFNDPSGDRLRDWMGIDRNTFYDSEKIGILPMGFCFPGTGKSGDLPPRPECAPAWQARILSQLPHVKLMLVIGKYAQNWHLGTRQKPTLTETVQNWRDYWPSQLPMPHPSPRNKLWLVKNPWFEQDVIPVMRQRIASILAQA